MWDRGWQDKGKMLKIKCISIYIYIFLIIIHRAIFNLAEKMEQIIIIVYTIIAVQKKGLIGCKKIQWKKNCSGPIERCE